jgi:hypothetical protein
MGWDPVMVAITISLLRQSLVERLRHVFSLETEVMNAHKFDHFWETKCRIRLWVPQGPASPRRKFNLHSSSVNV